LASDDTTSSPGQSGEVKQMEVTVADFSTMDRTGVENWCNENKVNCTFKEDYSDSVAEGGFISQSIKAGEKIQEGNTVIVTYSLGAKPSVEYQNALARAKTYSDIMHMSKKAIYDQLTSEYGDKFSADAAQYAVDHLNADWKANALASAKTYQETMHMSKSAIYDQLVSEYGEKFTAEEAQYAIDNLSD
ncbi:MAG TPA: Ltp family lipoprotein, partial [Clostridiales bacterium]|nr:Ltp family lipoprotein [Clostridiales bacterium]